MGTAINESKTLTKHISCKCKSKFNGTNSSQINGETKLSADVSIKKVMYVKKITFGILLHVIVKLENI